MEGAISVQYFRDTGRPRVTARQRRVQGGWRAVVLLLLPCVLGAATRGEEAPQDSMSTFTMRSESRVNITPAIEWLLVPDDALTPNEVMGPAHASEFQRHGKPYLAFGPMRGTIWARVTLYNGSGPADFVLEVANPRLPEVDFYIMAHGALDKVVHTGVARPFHNRELRSLSPMATVHVPLGASRTVYLRAHNTGELRLQLWLWQRDAYIEHATTAHNGELIMTGVLLAMAVFYLSLSLSLRERVYFYLCLFLFSWTLFYLSMTALGSMVLWPDAPMLANRGPTLFTFLMCAAFLLFAHSLSGVKEHTPWLSRASHCLVLVALLAMLFTLVFDHLSRIYLMLAIAAITPVLALLMALRGAAKGSVPARLFLLCWCLFHLGGLFIVGVTAYLRSPSAFATPQLNVVLVVSLFAWSLDLTARIRGRERQQKALLEARVEARTRELREAIDRIKTLTGLLPICAGCKKIRDDQGYWNSLESYFKERADVDFTHGICPECKERLYGEMLLDSPPGNPTSPPKDTPPGV